MILTELLAWFLVFALAYTIIYYLADFLIDQLKDFSHQWNVSPIVSGILILGIDLEESIVSSLAAVNNLPYLALGNLIGNTVIAIAISFGLPALFMTFKMEPLPRFYLLTLIVLGGTTVLSTIFPQYLLVIGLIHIILFILYFIYTIHLQQHHDDTLKTTKLEPYQEMTIEEEDETREMKVNNNDRELLGWLLLAKIIGSLVLIFLAGELLVLSAENIMITLNVDESFFGLVVMAFVTNVEEFWLIVKAIQKHQVTLGVSAEVGKILWNMSLVYGTSSILLQQFTYKPVMMHGALIMLLGTLLLALSIHYQKLSKLQALLFLGALLTFMSLNVRSLLIP